MVITELPLVRSKLLVPSPAGLLHRPRLCQIIERGLECKLTLISAPAGYGKTSSLVDFARHSPVPVCWYTVDERDRDVGLFVEYLFGEQFPDFGERTRAVLASQAGDSVHVPVGVAEELANEILALDAPLAVVVDNYESLDGTLGIRGFVRRFLEILPPNCHLMLGSRVLPDVPVTHLVAKPGEPRLAVFCTRGSGAVSAIPVSRLSGSGGRDRRAFRRVDYGHPASGRPAA